MSTVDPAEISKFEEMAHEWWEPDGKFKPLHQINPVRMGYIRTHLVGSHTAGLDGLNILDIGCGGGILSESLSQLRARVVAIDRSEKIIGIAKAHQRESRSDVDYRVQSLGDLAKESAGSFDAVMAMEVLEHVVDIPTFLAECAALLKPGGRLFFATLNRTPKAWLLAIAGAEYMLGWLPKGTHQYDKFVRPVELVEQLRQINVLVRDISGISYHVLSSRWALSRDPSVNYLGYGVYQPMG